MLMSDFFVQDLDSLEANTFGKADARKFFSDIEEAVRDDEIRSLTTKSSLLATKDLSIFSSMTRSMP